MMKVVNLKELLEKYRELERKVDEELAKLREENEKLRKELERRGSSTDSKTVEELKAYYEARLASERETAEKERRLREEAEEKLRQAIEELEKWRSLRELLEEILERAPEPIAIQAEASSSGSSVSTELARNLPSYDREIYEYLAKHRGIPFTAYQIAVATRRSPKSSMFRTALSRLVKLGLVEKNGDRYLVRRDAA